MKMARSLARVHTHTRTFIENILVIKNNKAFSVFNNIKGIKYSYL